LFLALLLILLADLAFALDSVPAVFAISDDPFIVYSANIFAILGLRALYFKIADSIERFHYMVYALSLTLILIGGEVLLANLIGKVPPLWSLCATLALMLGGIALSLARRPPSPGGAVG
jgi:tellurite resistance protein TerC